MSSEPHGTRQPLSWKERYQKGLASDEERRDMWRDFDNGWVMVAELVGATLTWGGIGWLLDRWLDLAPVLMSFGFVLGFATGFYLLWARATGRIGRPTSPADATTTSTNSHTAGNDDDG